MKKRDDSPEVDPRTKLRSWVWFFAFAGGALEALDPSWIYAEGMARVYIVLHILGKTALGLLVGAGVGYLIGLVGVAVDGIVPRRRPRRKFPPGWLSGALAGILIGTYNVVASPDKAQHDAEVAACNQMSAAIISAQSALDEAHNLQAESAANQGLAQFKHCRQPSARADEAQAHLILAIVEYRATEPYEAETKKAQTLADRCAKTFAITNEAVASRCQDTSAGAVQTLAQHFCDDSKNLTNDADDALAHLQYGLAIDEASQAIDSAGKCKNTYAYAYRGMALVRRATAYSHTGDPKHGRTDLQNAATLLSRCVDEIDADSEGRLRGQCAAALATLSTIRNASAASGTPP